MTVFNLFEFISNTIANRNPCGLNSGATASSGGAVQEEGLEVWRRRQSLQASGVAPNQEASIEATTETAGTDRETSGTQHSFCLFMGEIFHTLCCSSLLKHASVLNIVLSYMA